MSERDASPSPPASPPGDPSSPPLRSPSLSQDMASREDSPVPEDITVGGPEIESPQPEPSNGDIGVPEDEDDSGDIALAGAPPVPPTTTVAISPSSPTPTSSTSSRRQTPSPARPHSRESQPPQPRISIDSRASTSRRSGAFSPTLRSPTSPPGSLHLVTSPKFRSVEVPLPSLVSATASASASAPSVLGEPPPPDEGAPFESIAIDNDGPPPPPLPAQVGHKSTPSASKRSSWKLGGGEAKPEWGGFGVDAKGQPVAHGSVPVHPPPEKENGGPSRTSTPGSASGVSTPRRHAPPAHPHPFTLPTTPNSNVPSPVAPPSAPHPQGLGVKGVSTLDKFISRTRPQHLPPKSKNEDQEHLHEWEDMMAKSKEHEAERRKVSEQKRLEKERHIISITPRWEALLNDPDFSVARVKSNSITRQLWFEGVPPRLRGQAWSQAIGNTLALNKDAYRGYLRRAQKAHAQGRFPQEIAEQMERDIDQTLPTLHVFHKGSPLRQDLRDLISAWVVYRSDQAKGYAPYVSFVAAMFLLASSPSVAFLSMLNFLARPCMSAFYNEVRDEIDAYYRVFENLQADMFPRIFANCKNLGLRLPESYFRSVLVEQVPFAMACRLWDQIVLDGDGYIFRAALAIFGFLEPRLYYPDKEEILSVLEGRNAATNAITQRERERAKLRGEEYEEALDGKLSVFGIQEEPLFEWLEHDGWKDSRFERLVTRELPD